MKKSFAILTILLIIITGINSCDKINKPYTVDRNNAKCDTPAFPALDTNTLIQKYLLEDYTGHKCPNCPPAQTIANNMKKQMGDTLILMAIHAGDQAKPEAFTDSCSFYTDFQTEVGREWYKNFKISSLPNGMINRMFFDGKQVLGSAKWKGALNGITRVAPTVGIQIIPEENNGECCVYVKTTLLSAVENQIRLSVLLIEDSIIAPQLDPNTTICKYVHNHVLRTAIAPKEGDILNISAENSSQIKGYTITLNAAWKKEQCHIIAFIHDATTNEILQVEEIKLVE
jgi:hypothetical protein